MRDRTIGKAGDEAARSVLVPLSFLPSPKTWIEWLWPEDGHSRSAIYLESINDSLSHVFSCIPGQGFVEWGALNHRTATALPPPEMPEKSRHAFIPVVEFSHWLLFFINSPRVIGRKQHAVHKGLARKLSGQFPLHGWTEIMLEVTKPPEIDDGEPHEAHLTGRRALHFCRKHIRIKNGRLEYVRAHWRGDAAIGIKQSRYKVV